MAELSKTARAAMKAVQAGQAKKVVERTPEMAIRDLRLNRDAHLHVSPTDVDVLLVEYDKALARITTLESEAKTAAEVLGSLQNVNSTRIAQLEGQIAALMKTIEDLSVASVASVATAVASASGSESKLTDAIKALYYSAVWHADRPVDEKALWKAVRDAAGFEPGNAPEEIPAEISTEAPAEPLDLGGDAA